ncbi:MAG TPA: EcsC family protein [Acidisarcina sp.]
MEARDYAALREAVERLEHQSFAMSIASRVGVPMERLMRMLPAGAQNAIGTAVNKALEQCLRVALSGRTGGPPLGAMTPAPRNRAHKWMTGATGAAGGFFGLAGLAAELPVTTTLMLHSIAEIARSNGEDLSRPENALACLEVLAFSPDSKAADPIESAYYATRAALAQATREATAYLAEKGLVKRGAPALLQFLSKIGARFGIEVSEKAAAQLVPIAGAVGGMAVNVMFTAHFQRLAEGHFAVRRLERIYGPALVQQEYERLRLTTARS